MEMVVSEYNTKEVGNIKFATYKEYSDAYTSWIRNDWKIEPLTLLGCSLLSDGEKFIDLGANIGAFCIPIALIRKSPFLAVEALIDNVNLLQRAIEENNIKEASIVNAAIMDHKTTVYVKGQSAYGTVNDDGLGVAVSSVVGDELFQEYDFLDAKLVKIDIEGAELKAFKGMYKFLSSDINRAFIFEANGAHAYDGGYAPSDIVKIFEDLNYKIYMIVGRKLVPYKSTDLQPFGLINYLAMKNVPSQFEYDFRISELKEKEIIDGIVRTLTQMKPGYRKFMLKELEKAQSNIKEHERVVKAITNGHIG